MSCNDPRVGGRSRVQEAPGRRGSICSMRTPAVLRSRIRTSRLSSTRALRCQGTLTRAALRRSGNSTMPRHPSLFASSVVPRKTPAPSLTQVLVEAGHLPQSSRPGHSQSRGQEEVPRAVDVGAENEEMEPSLAYVQPVNYARRAIGQNRNMDQGPAWPVVRGRSGDGRPVFDDGVGIGRLGREGILSES